MKSLQWAAATAGVLARYVAMPLAERGNALHAAAHWAQVANGCAWALFLMLLWQAVAMREHWMERAGGVAVLALVAPSMWGERALLWAVAGGTLTSYLLGSSRRGPRGVGIQWLLLLAVLGGTLRLAAPVLARTAAEHAWLPSAPHAQQAAWLCHLVLLAWVSSKLLARRAQPVVRVFTAALWGAFFGVCRMQQEVAARSPEWGEVREFFGQWAGIPSWSVLGLAIGVSALALSLRDGARSALLALGGGAVHPAAHALTTLAAALPEATDGAQPQRG